MWYTLLVPSDIAAPGRVSRYCIAGYADVFVVGFHRRTSSAVSFPITADYEVITSQECICRCLLTGLQFCLHASTLHGKHSAVQLIWPPAGNSEGQDAAVQDQRYSEQAILLLPLHPHTFAILALRSWCLSPQVSFQYRYTAESVTMAPLRPQRTVECKTIDGTRLEAWLWETIGDGPAATIIMSHGVSF